MADVPHYIQTFAVAPVRTVKMTSSEGNNHICILLAIPVFPGIDNGINPQSVKIALQRQSVGVISPADFCRAFRRRAFEYPYVTVSGVSGNFRSALTPVVTTPKFLIDILL